MDIQCTYIYCLQHTIYGHIIRFYITVARWPLCHVDHRDSAKLSNDIGTPAYGEKHAQPVVSVRCLLFPVRAAINLSLNGPYSGAPYTARGFCIAR